MGECGSSDRVGGVIVFRVDTVPSRVGSRAVDYVVLDVSERIIFRTSSAAEADFVRVWAEDRALRASLA